MRGLYVVGALSAGYLLAFVLLLPRVGEGVIALTMFPLFAAAWFYGLRGGLLAGVIGVAIDITLMQTIGDHDGFRTSQIPRIIVALALSGGFGWVSDLLRRRDALLIENHAIQDALRAARDTLEEQVRVRTAELSATNETLAAEVVARREAEAAVRRDLEERKQLEARAAAADRLAVVGTLTAGIGHEINNPLAVITGNLEFIAEQCEDAPAPVKEALRDTRDAARRTGEIVRNMRVFVHTNNNTEPAVVRRVVNSAVQMVSNELRHRATLELDIEDTPPVVLSESQLGQVVLNLLTNATHALPENVENKVRVEVRGKPGGVEIRVTDTGVGVPADVRPRIFEPFFTTKPIGVGTGLGLWVCHHIVTSAGGTIELESSSGFGSTFRIELPTTRALGSPGLPGPLEARTGRLLVIDDDSAIRRAIDRFLKHHRLDIVASAEEALALLARGERFDCILCDVMMPEMDGTELFRRLQTEYPDQATRVIFMTGGAFTASTNEFLGTKRRMIEKPFEALQLEGLIQEVLKLGARS